MEPINQDLFKEISKKISEKYPLLKRFHFPNAGNFNNRSDIFAWVLVVDFDQKYVQIVLINV